MSGGDYFDLVDAIANRVAGDLEKCADESLKAALSITKVAVGPDLSAQQLKEKTRRIWRDGLAEIAAVLSAKASFDDVCMLAAAKALNVESLRTLLKKTYKSRNDVREKYSRESSVYRERLFSEMEKNSRLKLQTLELSAKVRSAQARKGGLEKSAEIRLAREYVVAEWLEKSNAYGNNKSAFARDYVRLIRQKYTDRNGDPLSVTEKTIREVWLKVSPVAGNPAG